MRYLVARMAVASLLATMLACGEPPGPTGPGGSTEPPVTSASYDGTWQLVEGHGPAGAVEVVEGYRITLNIEGETVGGTAACNSYGGDVSIEDATFEMRGGSMTEMACRSDVMESEAAYMAALQDADSIARDGDTLTLSGPATELRFEIVPPVPTSELVGTLWELESLIYGSGDDGAVSSAMPAELLLKGDGTIHGTTGCRDLYGDWIEYGDEIVFTTFGAKGDCPSELSEQDDHVVGVLGDGFVPTIEGDRLTVFGQGGLGLGYRKAD